MVRAAKPKDDKSSKSRAAPASPRAARDDKPEGEPRAKRREPLTRERIAATALELIESIGLEDFSTRRLGAALGCEAMALYNHYPSKDAVLDAVVDHMMRKLAVPPRDPRGWVERARTFARSYRGLARVHPRAFPLLATRRFNTPATLGLLDSIFAAFAEDGLSTRDAVYVFRMLNNFCGGTALDELAGQRTAAWPPLDGMAHLVSAAPLLAPERFDEVFEYGLDVILEGLARRVKPT